MSTRVGEATATSDGRSGETTANANVRQSSRIAQARKRQFGQDVTNTVGAAPRQVKAPRKVSTAQAQAQASSSTQAASATSQGATSSGQSEFNERRHKRFVKGLKPVSTAETTTPAFTLETLRATLTSAFSPTSAETSLQAAMLRAALTTAKEVRLERVNVNWPVASGLAIPRAASGILVVLQWPRRDNVLVRGVSVEELERADQPRCHDGDWLTPMRFRDEESEEMCVTGHVLAALVTSLLGSDVSASASGGDGPAAPIRWCDICDFSLDDKQPEYTRKRLTTPKLFARAARNGADALSLSLARGEVRSSLVFVFGGVAAKQTKSAILKRAREGLCYVWEVSEASLAAYQLAKDSIVVSNASAIWFVSGVNSGKTYVVVFGPALQELRPGSRAGWKDIGTGILTTVHLLLDLARRCCWSPEAAAEAAKGMRRALGSICGKRSKELGVGVHEQVDGVYIHSVRGGENARDLGVGAHERVDGVYVNKVRGGKLGGKRAKELGVGAHKRVDGVYVNAGRRGENSRDLGVGIHKQVDGVYVNKVRRGKLGGKLAKELGVGAHKRVDGVYVNAGRRGKLRRPLVDSVSAKKHTTTKLNKLDKDGPDALTQAELKQLEAKVTSELIAWKRILERKLTPRKFTAETAREFVKVAADAADELRTNLKGTPVLPFIVKKLRSKYSVPKSLSQDNICDALGCFNKCKHFLHVLDE